MIQSRIELFFKFIAHFDLIDKEILSTYYKKSQLTSFNNRNLMELNGFINKTIQFNDFQTIVKLELIFQQKVFRNKNFNANKFSPILSIYLNLQRKSFFYCLELQLCILSLIIGLNFSSKRMLLGKKIITFFCSNLNSHFSYFLLTELKEYNINIGWSFSTQVREYQVNMLNSYYFVKYLKKGE